MILEIGPLSENSSPCLVSQADYGPDFRVFSFDQRFCSSCESFTELVARISTQVKTSGVA